MVRTIAAVVVVLVVALAAVLVYASTRPDTFRVQRSASIDAPPEKIFPLINDLKGWAAWSPYEKKDPAMQRTFSGPASGPGAAYAWDGDSNAGAGRMEITEATAPSKVAIRLDFTRPFQTRNSVEFALVPEGAATTVTWTMFGPSPLVAKVMGLIFDMDKMIGQDFEDGLANLKRVAEQ